jgi:hypothetical protein
MQGVGSANHGGFVVSHLCELEKFACTYAPALRFIKFIWTNSTTAKRHFEPRPGMGERQLDVEVNASDDAEVNASMHQSMHQINA